MSACTEESCSLLRVALIILLGIVDTWTLVKISSIWLFLQNQSLNRHCIYLNAVCLPEDQVRWGLNLDDEICVFFFFSFPLFQTEVGKGELCSFFHYWERDFSRDLSEIVGPYWLLLKFWFRDILSSVVKTFTCLITLYYYEQNDVAFIAWYEPRMALKCWRECRTE